jgi:hypothetical protein
MVVFTIVMEPLTSVPPCHQSCLIAGYSWGLDHLDSQVRLKPFGIKAGSKIEGWRWCPWQVVGVSTCIANAFILQLPKRLTSWHHFAHWPCSCTGRAWATAQSGATINASRADTLLGLLAWMPNTCWPQCSKRTRYHGVLPSTLGLHNLDPQVPQWYRSCVLNCCSKPKLDIQLTTNRTSQICQR